MFDVHVIGGGPTGGIAALKAIDNGFSVVLSEEHKEIGEPKRCSGLLSKDGIKSLSDVVSFGDLIENEIYGAKIHLGNETLKIKRKKPVAFVIDRKRLDKKIIEIAEKKGAVVELGKRIKKTEGIKAKNIIGADGGNSTIAKIFNFPKIEKYVVTAQWEGKIKIEDINVVDVFLSSKIPGFFGWKIPKNEECAEIGLGVLAPNSIEKGIKYLEKKLDIEIPRKKMLFSIIPIKLRKKTSLRTKERNIILVGDAAGQVKATTGGGIVFGGNIAKIAGKYANNTLLYEFHWRRKFYIDLFLHSQIHDWYSQLSDEELRVIALELKEKGIERFLEEKGDMDKPSKMFSPKALPLLVGMMGINKKETGKKFKAQ